MRREGAQCKPYMPISWIWMNVERGNDMTKQNEKYLPILYPDHPFR